MSDTPRIEIRTVEPAYEQQIRALTGATHGAHQARLPHIFTDDGAHQHQLLDVVFGDDAAGSVHAFMALSGDALAGYVLIIPDAAGSPDQPVNAVIANICVVPEFQRQGIGRALLAHCEAQKDAHGWESLYAQVWHGNDTSHRLFGNAGYSAECTDYRLGTPSVREKPVLPKTFYRWLLPLCALLLATLWAYMFL